MKFNCDGMKEMILDSLERIDIQDVEFLRKEKEIKPEPGDKYRRYEATNEIVITIKGKLLDASVPAGER